MKKEKSSENNSESLMRNWSEEEIKEVEHLSQEAKEKLDMLPAAIKDTE